MSQGEASEVLRAFSLDLKRNNQDSLRAVSGTLPLREQEILGEELALTGCPDQTFSEHAQRPCLAEHLLQALL